MKADGSATDLSDGSEKPILRGRVHQLGLLIFIVLGGVLFAQAEQARAQKAVIIYVLSLVSLFATSSLYHRVHWQPQRRLWMRRLDRAMIFVLIAGTYTPFALLVLDGWLNQLIFYGLWLSVLLGFVFNLVWVSAPKWIRSLLYVAVGWACVPMAPDMLALIGWQVPTLILGGGVAYTIGAIFYALKKPNLKPGVFGYHELFHCFVLFGALLHYWAVYKVVVG